MVGQRGVPATFGGIEHHVEEIGSRLAARGHEVVVYCRTNYGNGALPAHRGMTLRHLPTAGTKHLDAIAHSAISTGAAMVSRPEIVHYHALGPGLLTPLPRYLSRAKVVQTIHGLDNERAKWGRGARAVLGSAAWLSARVPDATIVVSQALHEHYTRTWQRSTVYIPNGVDRPTVRPARQIEQRWGLRQGSYLLFLGRLVPEKAPDMLLRAFRRLPGDLRLVVAGGSSFTDDYVALLERLAAADPRVVMPGYVYGELLDELYSNAAAFVLPSLVEGLPLTLLEAASYGTPVVASAIPPNVEVLGERDRPGRRICPPGDEDGLVAALERSLADPAGERVAAAELRDEVLRTYRWDAVTEATEELYLRLVTP
jgi:glycosyltransferase involved in cell wall biosynthesis